MSTDLEIAHVTLSADAPGPHLLITGGVHGDEFEPMAAIRRLIDQFNRVDSLKLQAGRLTLMPVVNEAAFVHGARTAPDGLDLARSCPGSAGGSITERTAHALSRWIRSADYYIDLHSGGTAFSVLPLTGYMLHANASVLNWQRKMARAFNLSIVWGTAAALEGRSLSVARDANVPAIYAEYLGSGLCDSRGVEAYFDGCLNVLALLGIIERDEPACRVERTIEDPRPGSGHMQVCHPAPITGFFEPAVALSQQVTAGSPFGTVCDATGATQREIVADRSGIVLVLRTFSRVSAGESVGVILEISPRS